MGLLPLVVDKLRQDSKLHDANMSKSTFGTKNVPAYSQFMFQYVYYCKQVYFQQEQSKLSGEIAFFSNLRKRGFQSGLNHSIFLSLFDRLTLHHLLLFLNSSSTMLLVPNLRPSRCVLYHLR